MVQSSVIWLTLTTSRAQVFHYRIQQTEDGKFLIQGPKLTTFPTIQALVQYYSTQTDGHVITLLQSQIPAA